MRYFSFYFRLIFHGQVWFLSNCSCSSSSHSSSRSKYSLLNINLYFCLCVTHLFLWLLVTSVLSSFAALPPLFHIPLLQHHRGGWIFSSFIQNNAVCMMQGSSCINPVPGMVSNCALKMQVFSLQCCQQLETV